MDVGVTIFLTDRSIEPARVAVALEERGFAALFVPEHTHIPSSRRSPYPGGGELPDEYRRLFDPFVVLTAAAAATEHLRVGTGICLLAQHDPIVVAKAAASVDVLSRGRFTFGVGYGWNVEEMAAHGVDPKRRRAEVREKALAVKALWRDDEASFDGEFVSFEPTCSWPKPVQQPNPPVYVGGAAGPSVFRHVVEFADGWMPIGARAIDESLPELHRLAEEAGRDPSTIDIVPFGTGPKEERLVRLAETAGVRMAVSALPSAGEDVVLPLLDKWAGVAEAVRDL